MGSVVVGSLALGLAIVLMVKKKQGRTLTITSLIAGLAAVPLLSALTVPLLGGLDSVVAQVAIPLVVAMAAATWLFFELKEKGTARITPWIALLTPALFAAAAGPFMVPLEVVDNLLGNVDGAVMSMGSGG